MRSDFKSSVEIRPERASKVHGDDEAVGKRD